MDSDKDYRYHHPRGKRQEGGYFRTRGMDRTKSFSTEGRRGIKRPFEGHMDNFEKETDPAVISRREKQIEFGKNTPEYYNYSTAVPRYYQI